MHTKRKQKCSASRLQEERSGTRLQQSCVPGGERAHDFPLSPVAPADEAQLAKLADAHKRLGTDNAAVLAWHEPKLVRVLAPWLRPHWWYPTCRESQPPAENAHDAVTHRDEGLETLALLLLQPTYINKWTWRFK